MSLTVSELRSYIKSDLNVLLRGLHGTGKTGRLMEACQKEGYSFKVFNAANMDAYTDLVGVPKPVVNADGADELLMVRPRMIDDVEVIFVDELNRALDPKTTNALFELVQFRSINGEKLPKLKCVIAAMNPADHEEYDVAEVDPALLDRFHLVIDVEPEVSVSYLAVKFGTPLAQALVTWWKAHDHKKAGYVSPRRLEFIGEVFSKTQSKSALRAALPPGGTYDVNKLFTLLSESSLTDAERRELAAKRKAQEERLTNKSTTKRVKSASSSSVPASRAKVLLKEVEDYVNGTRNIARHESFSAIRRNARPDAVDYLFANDLNTRNSYVGQIEPRREAIIRALANGIGNNRLLTSYRNFLEDLTKSEAKLFYACLTQQKQYGISREYRKLLCRGAHPLQGEFPKFL